jgi:hypothetical protein
MIRLSNLLTKTVPPNEGISWKCAIHAKLYILKRAAHTTIDIYDFIISIESDVKQQNLIFL